MRRKLSPLTPLGLEDGARARSTLLETGLTTARGALADWLQPCLRWLAGVGATLGESAARRRPRPLVLDLTAGSVRFRSVSEFEFALSSKTGFPVAKIPDIVRRPAWELKKVATHIRHVEKRFAEVLTQSLEQPGLVGELMREVEIKLFSQDHGWRDLVEALNQKGSEHDQYKRLALVKYMQYLGSRQDVLRSIYLDKMRGDHGEADDAPDTRIGAAMLETSIFDVEPTPGSAQADEPHVEMPRGETIAVRLRSGEALDLRLSGHPFRLYAGRRFYLIDETGEQHLLRPGKNMVGRQADGDVVVPTELRAVSRRHLIIETLGEDCALLTDVSAHGTSIPQRFVGN
jgi:hypothetical protein